MIELSVVVAVIMIISGISIIQLQPAWQQIQANSGLDQVKSALRQARETAISQRRTIVVQFTGNTIQLFQMQVTLSGTSWTQVKAATPFLTLPIQSNVQFLSFAGESDTPDKYLGAAPTVPNGIYVNGTAGTPPTGVEFQSDGTFTDGSGTPVNLTIFLGVLKIPSTERAVTILGNTGRIQAWHGNGATNGWFL